LPKLSPYRSVWDKLLSGEYEMVVSTAILLEYFEILAQKTNQSIAENVLKLIVELPNVTFQHIHYHFNLIFHDPDDNKFVDCAIAANVTYIVSNDKHFNMLKQLDYPKVEVIQLENFAKTL
jgi:putative PIN family toxin of toxin-antitoxin system